MWNNRNVLVTGATGLLGSHLVEELINRGARVVSLVRDYVPHSRYYEKHTIIDSICVNGDVEDYYLMERIMNEYQIQTVFHLAAQTQVGIANRDPHPTLKTNIMGTINILEAARKLDIEQVVIASSDKAYGEAVRLPYDEQTPLRGKFPYDVSKTCADQIAQMYGYTYTMNVGITRCGNLFGPGDLNYNRLIPGTIKAILEHHPPIIRSDGKMTRDYFYVKDAVLAYLKLAEKMEDWIGSHEYNFSYGKPCSVLGMVNLIRRIMDAPSYSQPIIQNNASNEIPEQYLDSSKARRQLEWQPKWDLESALEETIDWYKGEFGL